MTFTPRLMRLGLTAALLGTTSLAACGGEAGEAADGEAGEAAVVSDAGETDTADAGTTSSSDAGYSGEMGEGEGGEGEGAGGPSHDPATMPRQNRLAFMRGHVEAGLALYRAGAPDQAARHLLHPVSETHAAEREGLDELGFKSDLFVEISKALDEGTSSEEIEDKLTEAEDNLSMMAGKVDGNPADIVDFLMASACPMAKSSMPVSIRTRLAS